MSNQPLADAFFAGKKAYQNGEDLKSNPFPKGDGSITDIHHQWNRGYINTRKSDRFNATIRARQEKKS